MLRSLATWHARPQLVSLTRFQPIALSMKLRTLTLGCKVNQYETEYVRQGLQQAGYSDAQQEEEADLCIVNTCTVTAEGDAKSRQAVRKLARHNPQSRIVVMGCYATRAPSELAALPNVVEVVTDKRELPDLLGRFGVVDVPQGISRFGDRHRAYLKVQDGCLLRCSFCIIPAVRPQMQSRQQDEIVAEAQRLIGAGYRELVLTGIHLGHYGVDFNRGRPKSEWIRLAGLVGRLIALPGDFRLRLSSIEATEVTRELVEVLHDAGPRVAPHLHISMQSGSDHVLRRMRRRWGSQRFVDRCLWVRERLDQPALTTDVIVGFPGETDSDFAQTCDVVREVGFSKIHIFPFSPRRGTPAATMPDQIPKQLKQARSRELAKLEAELRDQYQAGLAGRQLRVLVESPYSELPSAWVGTSCRFVPVVLPPQEGGSMSQTLAAGDFVDVTAGRTIGGKIFPQTRVMTTAGQVESVHRCTR